MRSSFPARGLYSIGSCRVDAKEASDRMRNRENGNGKLHALWRRSKSLAILKAIFIYFFIYIYISIEVFDRLIVTVKMK